MLLTLNSKFMYFNVRMSTEAETQLNEGAHYLNINFKNKKVTFNECLS